MIGTDSKKFGSVITAMITPFTDKDEVDFPATKKLVDHLIATGTTSVVVSGTTGENPTLEDSEKVDLLKCVIEAVDGRIAVIMGTGSNTTKKSIKATFEAEKLGADGVLVVAPYYNKPSQSGMLSHFSEVCNATSLPVFLYNIPSRTGVNVAVSTVLELTERCPNLYALKDSSGNVEQAAEIAGQARADFRIYSGDDNLTLPFLSVGATGVISVASHLLGKEIAEMIKLFHDGKLDQSRTIFYQCLPMFKGLFAVTNPTCLKYALSKQGICGEGLRLPLVPLSNEERAAMDKLLDQSKQKSGVHR